MIKICAETSREGSEKKWRNRWQHWRKKERRKDTDTEISADGEKEGAPDATGSKEHEALCMKILQAMKDLTLQQVDIAWRKLQPTLEQSIPEGLVPMEQTHTGAVLEELQPMEKIHH